MTSDQIIDLFVANANKAGAEIIRSKDMEETNRILLSLLKQDDTVFCPRLTEVEEAVFIPPYHRTEDYKEATICLEEATAAIAETGSLIYSSQGGRVLPAGLLPSHHVAMIRAENIYETLDDFFAHLGNSPPTYLAFETGPSRTADIELQITLGVHGPERLTILLLGHLLLGSGPPSCARPTFSPR